MPFVIDHSVVSGWYLEDQATAYTGHVAARLAEERACAPALWELELTNVLPTSCLRRRLTAEEAQQILTHIARRRSTPTGMPCLATNCWRWHCASA